MFNYMLQKVCSTLKKSEMKTPLKTLAKENIYKLFFFDIGLLHLILDSNYQ